MGSNQKYRDQIADLFLREPETGRRMVITSALVPLKDGFASFEVGEDSPNGSRWRITYKMEEVDDDSYRIFRDGDQWCAVTRDFINLQESEAGFGDTPEQALAVLRLVQSGKGGEAIA